jgi:hypothetical protein
MRLPNMPPDIQAKILPDKNCSDGETRHDAENKLITSNNLNYNIIFGFFFSIFEAIFEIFI